MLSSTPPSSTASFRTTTNKKRRRTRVDEKTPSRGPATELDARRPNASLGTGVTVGLLGSLGLFVFAIAFVRHAVGRLPAAADVNEEHFTPLAKVVERLHVHLQRGVGKDADGLVDALGQIWSARAKSMSHRTKIQLRGPGCTPGFATCACSKGRRL